MYSIRRMYPFAADEYIWVLALLVLCDLRGLHSMLARAKWIEYNVLGP